jgi:hypothetical protein
MPIDHKDLVAAGSPIVATLTLSQLNQLTGLVGGVLGIVYLLWKWSREAKK